VHAHLRAAAFGCFVLCIAVLTVDSGVAAEEGPVYLAYAGPYSSSPSSAFGHLFLVIPGADNEPVLLWDVISFSAETHGAGPVRYMIVGMTGGFLGRYQRLEFHEKSRDYQMLDDRDLWLVRLNLSHDQQQMLAAEMAASEGRWFPYTFFVKNCAYYLQLLLSRAIEAIPAPHGPTSPIGVMDTVLRSEIAGPCFFRPAESRRLVRLAADVTPDIVGHLRQTRWTDVVRDTTWLRALSTDDRLFVQEYLGWKMLAHEVPLERSALQGIGLIRLLNALESDVAAAPVGNALGRPVPAPEFHSYSKVTLAFRTIETEEPRVSLRYRPALHEQTDPWLAHRPVNTLEFGSVEISTATSGTSLRLEEVVLFAQRSLSPSDWIASRRSWLLEARVRRGGLFGEDALHSSARGGLGRTWRLSDECFIYVLLTGAVVGADGAGIAFAPGIEVGALALALPNCRLGLQLREEHDVTEWPNGDRHLQSWVRVDLSRDWGATLELTVAQSCTRAELAVCWYP